MSKISAWKEFARVNNPDAKLVLVGNKCDIAQPETEFNTLM